MTGDDAERGWRIGRATGGLVFVLLGPLYVIGRIPQPDLVMDGRFADDATSVELTFSLDMTASLILWVVSVGAIYGAVGAVSWWLGRHSIPVERWDQRLGRTRDALLSFVVLGVLGMAIAAQMATPSARAVSCAPPGCRVPLLFDLADAARLLSPWIVGIPLLFGLVTRIVIPPPPSTHTSVALRYQVATLVATGLLALSGLLLWAVLLAGE